MSSGYLQIQRGSLPPLGVQTSDGMVLAVGWDKTRRSEPFEKMAGDPSEFRLLHSLQQDLEAYFAGRDITFEWPFAWEQGSPFEKAVWQALRKVPYGEMRSYQWVAECIGRPRAVRAVGNANGKNPFSLVVPCHRIIHKDGSLGGYTGGATIKKALLALEQNSVEQ